MSLTLGTAGTLIDLTATRSGRTLSACCDQFYSCEQQVDGVPHRGKQCRLTGLAISRRPSPKFPLVIAD
jgi:hypothetical protein